MKKISLFLSMALGVFFANAQCDPPSNTTCDDALQVFDQCDDCMSMTNIFYTQCSPSGSYLPRALNAPLSAIPDDEVWFMFLPPRNITGLSTQNSDFTINVVGNCEMNPIIELYSSCPRSQQSADHIGLSNGSRIASLNAVLDACTPYYFRVYHEGVDGSGGGDYSFALEVDVKRVDNDDCDNPYTLSINNTWVDASNVNSTESSVSSSCTYTGSPHFSGATTDDDVWFKFNSGSNTDVKVTVQPVTQCAGSGLSTTFDPALEFFSVDPCNGSPNPDRCINEVQGNSAESFTFTCLASNTDYYIRVMDVNNIDCINGAEFQIKLESSSCSAPANNNLCHAKLLNSGWQGYSNEQIEDGNAFGVSPNVTGARNLYGGATVACADLESSKQEPSPPNGGVQSVWYRFLAPQHCETDVILHTNNSITDFNTVIAVYESVAGYSATDDLATDPNGYINCSDDYTDYINATPVATSDDWPGTGPSVTSGNTMLNNTCSPTAYHTAFSVPSGSTNSYLKLTTKSGQTNSINPGQIYFVQVAAVTGGNCVQGNFDLFFQVDLPLPTLGTPSSSAAPCGAGYWSMPVSWTCNGTPADEFEVLRSNTNPLTEPNIPCGAVFYATSPNPVTSTPYTSTLNCLLCDEDYEVWVRYKTFNYNGVNQSNKLTYATYSLEFNIPCPPASPPPPGGGSDPSTQRVDQPQVERTLINNKIKLFPNPSNSEVVNMNYVFNNSKSKELTVYIHAVNGEQVFTKKYVDIDPEFGQLSLEVQNLPKGTYYVQVIKDGSEYTEKMLLE